MAEAMTWDDFLQKRIGKIEADGKVIEIYRNAITVIGSNGGSFSMEGVPASLLVPKNGESGFTEITGVIVEEGEKFIFHSIPEENTTQEVVKEEEIFYSLNPDHTLKIYM